MRTRTRPFNSDAVTLTLIERSGSGSISGGQFATESEAWSAPLRSAYAPYPRQLESIVNVDTMTDTTTTDYFKLVRSGGFLPVNPCNRVRQYSEGGLSMGVYTRSVSPISGGRFNRYDLYASSLRVMPEATIAIGTLPNYQPLLTDAIARWKSQSWDASTFLAELGKTSNMVANAVHNFDIYAKECLALMKRRNKRNFRTAADALDLFSSIWLEGRFGWRLLYYDIVDIQDAVHSLSEGNSARNKYAVTDRETRSSQTPWTKFGPIKYRYSRAINIETRAGCFGDIRPLSQIGFDPIVTAYEVIPWSFVLDYVIDIGSAIQAASPLAIGDLKGSWYSYNVSATSTIEWDGVDGSVIMSMSPISSGGQTVRESYERNAVNPTYQPKLFKAKGLNFVDVAALAFKSRARLLKGILKLVKRA